jgi:hypothetical protein
MTAMTTAEIQTLNAMYSAAIEQSDESPNVVTHEVAVAASLEVVRRDDESGILYRNAAGRYVYGWESGGFDDQIGE